MQQPDLFTPKPEALTFWQRMGEWMMRDHDPTDGGTNVNQHSLWPQATRNSDPSTSRAAELEITRSGCRATQAEQVFALVRRYPGRTSAELAAMHGGLDRWQVARRLPDLRRLGRVETGDAKMCQMQRRNSVTWWPASTDNR